MLHQRKAEKPISWNDRLPARFTHAGPEVRAHVGDIAETA